MKFERVDYYQSHLSVRGAPTTVTTPEAKSNDWS